MLAGIDAPKTAPAQVAAGLLDGLAADEEDIFPDPNAQAMAPTWWSDPKRSSARSPARLRRDRQHPERRGRADARPRRRAAAGCARMESAGCLRRYGPFLARDSEPNHGKSWMTSTV